MASDDITMILPPNRSTNADIPYAKNASCLVGKAAMAFDFKKCCTAKGQRFRRPNENHFRTYLWVVYSSSHKGLNCRYCATFSASLVNCGVEKNCQKPGKLFTEPLCSLKNWTVAMDILPVST